MPDIIPRAVSSLRNIENLLAFDGHEWRVKRGQIKALSIVCETAADLLEQQSADNARQAAVINRLTDEVQRLIGENEQLNERLSQPTYDYDWISVERKTQAARIAELEAYIAELERLRDAEFCHYSIHTPSEEGYTDVKGRFYQCSCRASYIDIETAEDWTYCPHCGKEIASKETLFCTECESAEWDGDCYYCNNSAGKHAGEIVDDAGFCGCDEWCQRSEPPKEASNNAVD